MLIYDYHNAKKVIENLDDPIARRIISYLPPTRENEGISMYLKTLIADGKKTIFTRVSEIVQKYLDRVKEGFEGKPLLLYDPAERTESPSELLPMDGLTEQERIQEQMWHSDYLRHWEHDRERDRPVDRGRLAEGHKRRIVISMQGKRSRDFADCDSKAKITPRWRRINKVTWHHAENITTSIEDGEVKFYCDMYLVPYKNHAGPNKSHSGGCAEYRKYTGRRYR